MTEDEAKTKWCPFARHPVLVNYSTVVSVNRGTDDDSLIQGISRCIGSRCMGWVAEKELADDGWLPTGGGLCGFIQ